MIGGTLARYLSIRFARTILATFAGVFTLIFTVDLVETLRRSGDTPAATGPLLAWLSFLHTPTVAEQALPFAVLFGAMISFLGLSRKLELVVARAAGVSVWQFLAPPLAVVVVIGIVSVALYNPVSAAMKQRADAIEAKLFGSGGQSSGAAGLWLRQKSVDGQAIIHADGVADSGATLSKVTVFAFDKDGTFTERIDAASAALHDGFWRLEQAEVVTPGLETQSAATYLLATTLTLGEVSQSYMAPETVPFWSLSPLAEQIERAGLDATGYRLRYQVLIARPLMLMAMVLVAASFSLRFFRMGGVGFMVSGGVTAGFVLYVATKLVSDLGGAGFVSTPVAGWSPAVVGCLFGVLVLLHQEDG
ncbi:LPS export ABC transporter permease LptG [Methylocapsa sp. S129]|uniref:LPS export ABC transporter permease LptG n=1 Tax=Methylocapsa sp. S129 TaxID=1641869 RepID=UPI00131B77ED|nr:LPS export ABC transporter permease LptG [Methylocapsa sp. S129]